MEFFIGQIIDALTKEVNILEQGIHGCFSFALRRAARG
jgi:hypothetical protein